jgi:hypothetical protein
MQFMHSYDIDLQYFRAGKIIFVHGNAFYTPLGYDSEVININIFVQ